MPGPVAASIAPLAEEAGEGWDAKAAEAFERGLPQATEATFDQVERLVAAHALAARMPAKDLWANALTWWLRGVDPANEATLQRITEKMWAEGPREDDLDPPPIAA